MSLIVEIPSRPYEDDDDCLSAAQTDARRALDLDGWDLSPRWGDEDREMISLTVPAHVAAAAEEWASGQRRVRS